MFTSSDEQFLLRAMNQNRAILFMGAGASHSAQNSLGTDVPLSGALSEDMWSFLEYEGEYDNTPLPDMYQAVLGSGLPFSQIEDFLNSRLLCSSVPDRYDQLTRPVWYRIYTTNVDDLLDIVWRRSSKSKLDVLTFPKDDVHERDQLLRVTQAVFLHGKLPCRPDEVTFSTRQYAKRAIGHDPLYEQFVRDYTSLPVVFVGTELNEPLFWQYIELREARGQAASEQRPKSFLISKRISPAKKATLKDLNVVPVEATVDDFLGWIASKSGEIDGPNEVLRLTLPSLAYLGGKQQSQNLGEFAVAFHNVPVSRPTDDAGRSKYLLGTTPKWEDILNDLDAPRSITGDIVQEIFNLHKSEPKVHLLPILGSAGCGKSTILRRVGVTLAQSGITTLLTNSEELPRPAQIARAIQEIPTRVVLLFDNAEAALGVLPAIVRELKTVDRPPIILIATRTNEYDRRLGKFDDTCEIHEYPVPHLDLNEIKAVISVLEKHHLLGRLRGMNEAERIREFQMRANRQILVAMREATTGRGFDEIIRDEFEKLPSDEAKVLYLCTALATDAGYRIRKDELVGCARVKPAEAMYLIERSLGDVVLPTGVGEQLLLLRHRRIAEFMVDEAAPRRLMAIAYIRLLRMLAGQLGQRSWRSRSFAFYRDVINHQTIFRRFEHDINSARDVYESLREYFAEDPQFWLQYGSLELEANVLDLAENYLSQALSLDPEDRFAKNAMGHLMLRKALAAESKAQAIKLREDGSSVLLEQIHDYQATDLHCYHIYCSQRLGWIRKWGSTVEERKQELEDLRGIIAKGCGRFPRARELAQLKQDIERDYLNLAVPGAR